MTVTVGETLDAIETKDLGKINAIFARANADAASIDFVLNLAKDRIGKKAVAQIRADLRL